MKSVKLIDFIYIFINRKLHSSFHSKLHIIYKWNFKVNKLTSNKFYYSKFIKNIYNTINQINCRNLVKNL